MTGSRRSVYVIKSSAGPIKIGIASHTRHRLYGLRNASAFKLSLEFEGECEKLAAQEIEKRAHEVLAAHALNGEWFSVSSERAIEVLSDVARELNHTMISIPIVVAPRPRRLKEGGRNMRLIQLRVTPDFLQIIDNWRRERPEMPKRTEALRKLVERGLTVRTGDEINVVSR